MKLKHLILGIQLLAMCTLSMSAQETSDLYSIKNGAVVVEKIIAFDVSKEIASAAVKSYFLTTLNDSNETLKNSSDDYYVAKIMTPKLHQYSMGWFTVGYLTIDVKFKEDRMKVSVSCNDILNSNSNGSNATHYNPIDAAPINPKHDSWKYNIMKKPAEETFKNLVLYMASIVVELNSSVQNAKAEEDW